MLGQEPGLPGLPGLELEGEVGAQDAGHKSTSLAQQEESEKLDGIEQ